jgi:hypothetical protein
MASGAVFSKGKLIFIDGEKFADWLATGEESHG